MRRATASTWLIGLVIGFILIFVAYILMTINYSKTIRIKNDMIDMIEKYEGLNYNSLSLVNNYLASINQKIVGDCGAGEGFYGAPDLNSPILEQAQSGQKYYYCIKKFKGAGTSTYYQVTIFYRFNLPVVGAAGIFTVRGVTGNFQPHDDSAYAQATDGSYTSSITSPSTGGGTGGTTGGGTGGTTGGSTPTTPTMCTVSFSVNGGVGSFPSQTFECGGKATDPGVPTRDGYTFNGWVLSGGTRYNFNNPVNSNISLLASWSRNSRVPTRDEIRSFALYYKAPGVSYDPGDTKYYDMLYCNASGCPSQLRDEYSNDWNYYTEELIKDYQDAYDIIFTEEEKQEFRDNWRR